MMIMVSFKKQKINLNYEYNWSGSENDHQKVEFRRLETKMKFKGTELQMWRQQPNVWE